MKTTDKVPAWLSAPLIVGAFGVLWWLERRRPLRLDADEPKLRREARNLSVAATAALALRLTEQPVAERLTALVERRKVGLLKLVRLPAWLETALAVLLLDYTLYLWHVATHRAPALWRFHAVHHADLDLDASTALRFHFGELVVSVAWRAGQIVLIGVSPLALSVWQTLLMVSVLFHHSNVRLPIALERRLSSFVVTPRMHGIHHSTVRAESDSNWSSGLSVWDRLHDTMRLNVAQAAVEIGVPAYRDAAELTLPKLLALPFRPARTPWLLPDGTRPAREGSPTASTRQLQV